MNIGELTKLLEDQVNNKELIVACCQTNCNQYRVEEPNSGKKHWLDSTVVPDGYLKVSHTYCPTHYEEAMQEVMDMKNED